MFHLERIYMFSFFLVSLYLSVLIDQVDRQNNLGSVVIDEFFLLLAVCSHVLMTFLTSKFVLLTTSGV
uniref:Uncharacterized protein n=1 Tax=Rhizophora mucronata TaxID=61149 RepID=A0A2P2J056_RHIMU